MRNVFLHIILWVLQTIWVQSLCATTYIVSTKNDLQNRMSNAIPGDIVIVANGTYNNWGNIDFTNSKGSPSSDWITLKAENFKGVFFTGNVNLSFKGTRVRIDGFVFTNGNAGTNAVIDFRNAAGSSANYCRISNILIDNFNTPSPDSTLENEWVGLYGKHNRIDHCSFINKFNSRATVVVWYSSTTYPAQAVSTYHVIDSNYFANRSFQGANGGECMRIGDSNSSRTNGYNTIEYNLFEDCIQTEPEIISNKSNFNTYRYNTFKNCNGGLTLRHGRYCSVYSNFFIVNDATKTKSYGVRVIDKGHKVYNNYFEGLLGNKNSLNTLRCPIILYNGLSSTNDTTDATKASGYFPADSTLIAFNTIANCVGGAGVLLGYTDGGNNSFQPKGIQVVNNLLKMTSGQAVYNDPLNSALTYNAAGNIINAPNGVGLSNSNGFTSTTINFSGSNNNVLTPPSLVQDAAISSSNYAGLLDNKDAMSQNRSSTFDVGCYELNGSGNILTFPLDSNMVGAGKPVILLPVHLLSFKGQSLNRSVNLGWAVVNELNLNRYEIEWSQNKEQFSRVGSVIAKGFSGGNIAYQFQHKDFANGNNYYRLKMVDKNGQYQYSPILMIQLDKQVSLNIYPNPAQQFITVEINGIVHPQTKMVLINALGIVVKEKIVKGNTNSISLKNLVAGVYSLQLVEHSKVLSTYPFLISAK